MAGTQVQRRRGTTAEHATFVGAVGELTVDLNKKTVVVHDGVTPGGNPLPTGTAPAFIGGVSVDDGLTVVGGASIDGGLTVVGGASVDDGLTVVGGASVDGSPVLTDATFPVGTRVLQDAPTGAASMPSGTTAERPSTPSNGMLRYNSEVKDFEFQIDGAWVSRTTLTRALDEAPIVTIASASSINIGAAAANTIAITGLTAISSLGVFAAGAVRRLIFNGAPTLAHSANIILPTSTNITAAPGDVAEFVSLGSGSWRCISYQRADGRPLVGPDSKQLCTAWVNFDGTGTVAIRDSFNVSSITDNGTGDYTVNFATPMANTNYSVGSCPFRDGVGNVANPFTVTFSVNSVRIEVRNGVSPLLDSGIVNIQTFGGK